jgi:hypothetical protein
MPVGASRRKSAQVVASRRKSAQVGHFQCPRKKELELIFDLRYSEQQSTDYSRKRYNSKFEKTGKDPLLQLFDFF